MTSPIETNNVVERLREIGRAIRCGHVVTVRALVDDWHFSPDEAADLIEGLAKLLREARQHVRTVDGIIEVKIDVALASLTQGGK